MRKSVFIVLLLLLVSGCENNKIDRPPKPDNLLSEDKMVEVIYDMTLISAAKGISRRTLENNGINPEEFVFSKYNIDSVQFALSNQYYSYDIKTYDEIYDRVKARLERDKARLQSEEQSKNSTEDSISRANRIRRDSLIRAKTEVLNPDL